MIKSIVRTFIIVFGLNILPLDLAKKLDINKYELDQQLNSLLKNMILFVLYLVAYLSCHEKAIKAL